MLGTDPIQNDKEINRTSTENISGTMIWPWEKLSKRDKSMKENYTNARWEMMEDAQRTTRNNYTKWESMLPGKYTAKYKRQVREKACQIWEEIQRNNYK